MAGMEIHLNPRLTQAHQAAVLTYFRNPRALQKDEWVTALAAFDLLGALLPQPVKVLVKGQGLVVVEYNLWKEKILALQQ